MIFKPMVRPFLLIILIVICSLELHAFSPSLKVGFVKNVGQIKDQYGLENKDVLYLFKANNMQVQLRKNGFS